MSIKISIDAIGNRTHDLPACSAVPQPTAPPRVSKNELRLREISGPKREDVEYFLNGAYRLCVCLIVSDLETSKTRDPGTTWTLEQRKKNTVWEELTDW